MKKYVRFLGFILTLSAAVVLNACSSDDDHRNGNGNGGGNQVTASMTGKINDVPFSWTGGDARVINDALTLTGRGVDFVPRITLTIPADAVAGGSYTVLLSGGDARAVFMNSEGMQITASSGTVNVTEHDRTARRIKGTFYFETVANPVAPANSITEGTFEYIYEIL